MRDLVFLITLAKVVDVTRGGGACQSTDPKAPKVWFKLVIVGHGNFLAGARRFASTLGSIAVIKIERKFRADVIAGRD